MGVAASTSYTPPHSLASNRRRGRRIRSGRLRPNIESLDEAHRSGRGPRRASRGRRTPNRDKNRRKIIGSSIFSGIEHIIECGKAGGCTRRLEPRFAWNRIAADDVESISCDFDAAREANSQLELFAEIGDRVAHAVPIAERAVCHHDHKARKHAPKRAVRDIGRS